MTKEERTTEENIVRVAMNLAVILDIGLFPGKHTLGIEEAKGLVKSIIENSQARLHALEPAPPPPAA